MAKEVGGFGFGDVHGAGSSLGGNLGESVAASHSGGGGNGGGQPDANTGTGVVKPVKPEKGDMPGPVGSAVHPGAGAPDAGYVGSRPADVDRVTSDPQDVEGGGFAYTSEAKGQGPNGENVGETHYLDRTGKETRMEVAGPETGYNAGIKGLHPKEISSVAPRESGGEDFTANAEEAYRNDQESKPNYAKPGTRSR